MSQKGADAGNHGSASYFYVVLAITEGSTAPETMRRPKFFVELRGWVKLYAKKSTKNCSCRSHAFLCSIFYNPLMEKCHVLSTGLMFC